MVGGGVPSAPFIGRECAPPYLPCAAKRLEVCSVVKTTLNSISAKSKTTVTYR